MLPFRGDSPTFVGQPDAERNHPLPADHDQAALPGAARVVGRETFERQHLNKVDQVLQDVAGVQSQFYGYDSDTNWFYIRGFNSFDTGAFSTGCRCSPTGSGRFTSTRSCSSASRY